MAFENVQMIDAPADSHVQAFGYDPVARVLVVRWRGGTGGVYHGATEEDFAGLQQSEHPGSYIHRSIKPKYGYERI